MRSYLGFANINNSQLTNCNKNVYYATHLCYLSNCDMIFEEDIRHRMGTFHNKVIYAFCVAAEVIPRWLPPLLSCIGMYHLSHLYSIMAPGINVYWVWLRLDMKHKLGVLCCLFMVWQNTKSVTYIYIYISMDQDHIHIYRHCICYAYSRYCDFLSLFLSMNWSWRL